MNANYCSNCGAKIDSESAFCTNCGKRVDHTGSVHTEIKSHHTSSSEKHVISFFKLLLLNLLTFGTYVIYWGWKNWEIIKRVTGRNMHTGVRGFFINFTSFELFKLILRLAKDHGYKGNYSPNLLATGFLIFIFINNRVGNTDAEMDWLVLMAVTAGVIFIITLIMSPVVNAMNYYLKNNNEDSEKFKIKPNYTLIAILVLILCLFIGLGIAEGWNTIDYDDTTRNDFVNACVDAGGTESYCSCYYGEITNRYTYEEYTSYNSSKDATLPEHEEIVNACRN